MMHAQVSVMVLLLKVMQDGERVLKFGRPLSAGRYIHGQFIYGWMVENVKTLFVGR